MKIEKCTSLTLRKERKRKDWVESISGDSHNINGGPENRKWGKIVFQELVVENFLKFDENHKLSNSTSRKRNRKKTALRCVIVKLLKIKNEEKKILKSTNEENDGSHIGTSWYKLPLSSLQK